MEKEITTTKITESPVIGEPAQEVFEKKKTIFRFSQVIWYILGIFEMLFAFRFLLKALGANPNSGFTNFIYSLTDPLVNPFGGIVAPVASGNSIIEWSTGIAALIYFCIAWALVYLLDLFFPITPKDIENKNL